MLRKFVILFIIVEATTNYTEPFRPQFHFTPPSGWTNDPNGLVYYDGYWQLFYQYNPDIDGGGLYKHWGHARSTDLFHWENLPVAISPYNNSAGNEVSIFSGSAIADYNNVTGLTPPGSNSSSTLLAFYTAHEVDKWHETQAMAYSRDKGISWTRFENNPVIENPGAHDFRDPKVFRYNEKFIAVVATGDHVGLYESPDLALHWQLMSTYRSEFSAEDSPWECSDLFKLGQHWVLLVNHDARTEYFIGEFDGQNFATTTSSYKDRLYLDYGLNSYAGVTYEAAPDGRRVFLSWLPGFRPYAEKTPTSPWRGSMSLPRELSIVRLSGFDIVASQPVKEIALLYDDGDEFSFQTVCLKATVPVAEFGTNLLDLRMRAASVPSGGRFGITFAGESDKITVYHQKNEYFIDRQDTERDFSAEFEILMSAPRLKSSPDHSLRIVLDVSSIEVFIDDGLSVVTAQFFSRQKLSAVSVFFESNDTDSMVEMVSISVNQLQSAWR